MDDLSSGQTAQVARAAQAAFLAVDLDAVLDNFESEEQSNLDAEAVCSSKRNLLPPDDDVEQECEQESSANDLPPPSNGMNGDSEPEDGGHAPVCESSDQEQKTCEDLDAAAGAEEACAEFGETPFTPSKEAEGGSADEEQAAEQKSPVSPSSDSRSSSPPFQSVYESNGTENDDEEEEEDAEGAAYTRAETPRLASPVAEPPSTPDRQTGARPKQSLSATITPTTPMSPSESQSRGFEDQPRHHPVESPPPYSEVDPMRRERPSNLEIPQETSPAENGTGEVEEQDLLQEQLSAELDVPAEGARGPPGETPNHPTGTNSATLLLQGLSDEQLSLGLMSPLWVPDADAPGCMICDSKFTLVRRRHHCRACGKVLCGNCCSERSPLKYMERKVARVCKPCLSVLQRLDSVDTLSGHDDSGASASSASGSAASAVGPAPAPVGVLKRGGEAAATPASEAKQVIFSDGIRPGGDLTELDEDVARPLTRLRISQQQHRSKTASRRSARAASQASAALALEAGRSLLPPDRHLLPLVHGQQELPDPETVAPLFVGDAPLSVPFVVNRILKVWVKLVKYAPIDKEVWNYRTEGLSSVGQDEIVLLLLKSPEESLPPREVFDHFQDMFEQAKSGSPVSDMSYSRVEPNFLGFSDLGGFLYLRPSFQCMDNLDLPQSPFLFCVLITKWEMPWARLFPLRLMLRLGAECRYYPAPLWSVRGRRTVYGAIGNTIMKLLSDFTNYTYSLPIIRGMLIHMEHKMTTVLVPKNRYRQIQRALLNSNDPVLALGADFSTVADSHLVAVQTDEDHPPKHSASASDYETQAINIHNKTRKVTGASFIVFNGALKSTSGLTAKSSIVEDGIMVQVSQERMSQVRKSLEKMEEVRIECGPVASPEPDEVIVVRWIDEDCSMNAGVKSPIDGMSMAGIASIRLHSGRDHVSDRTNLFIRWVEAFLLSSASPSGSAGFEADPPDPMTAATIVAKAVCVGLLPHLQKLHLASLSPLAVRVNLDVDSVGYEAGSEGNPLPADCMNSLDEALIPVINSDVSSVRASIELLFHILEY